jgi:hypothetical protein
MPFSAGKTVVSTTVAVTATVPAPGNAPAHALRERTATPAGAATQTLGFGVGSGLADVFCDGEYQLAAGGALTLNLFDGGVTTSDLTTSFGAAANLRRVKNVTVLLASGGDSSGVTVGGAASNAFTGFWASTFTIFPGGPMPPFGSPAGATVSSSQKNVKLLNNSSSATAVVQVFVTGAGTTAGEPDGWLWLWTNP